MLTRHELSVFYQIQKPHLPKPKGRQIVAGQDKHGQQYGAKTMTVAYSAFKKNVSMFVMGADDKDAHSTNRVSKIRIANPRWAFCVLGIDNPIHCLNEYLPQLSEEDILTGWPNINEVVHDLAKCTSKYTQRQTHELSSIPENRQYFENLKDATCSVIIFDAQDFELFEVNLGKLYPAEKFTADQIQIRPLKEGVLHLHAMATNRTSQVREVPIPSDFFDTPKESLAKLINEDIEWHNRERKIQGENAVPYIGNLGSYAAVFNGKLEYILC